MLSWPKPYLPPALPGIAHPDLQLFDSYKNSFYSLSEEAISSYICGITPYDATHLGHAATYITYDLAHRYLIASGKKVVMVQNITDIDDPLLERANRDSIEWQGLATNQIDLFRSDMTALRVIPPDAYQGVVEAMPAIIDDIMKLVARGLTYELAGDVYLEIERVEGALSELPFGIDEAIAIFAERGGDPTREGKRHPLDTLLWLSARKGEPSWDSPLGRGRPGWHIECLSIATHSAPPNESSCITIQGGGSDLYFPHHYMTNVQSKALTGKAFAAVFTHAGMIGLAGEKMSKSKGNLLFVSKLISQGVKPEVIRLSLISRHYRSDTMWEMSRFEDAQELLVRLEKALARDDVAPTQPVISEMVSALAEDLDTPRAISILESWCRDTDSGSIGGNSGELARALDLYLGLAL